jgi:dihydrofolate reductase
MARKASGGQVDLRLVRFGVTTAGREEPTMRIVTYGAAVSLDGFIAGPKGELDWLHFSKDVQKVMGDYWKTIDTILMGRKTWSQSVKEGHDDGGAGFGKEIQTYIFSRTLKEIPGKEAKLVTTDAVAFVRDLKQKPGKGICLMGGGDFARSMFQAGLVDEMGLNIHPVLLGSGIPMFPDIGKQIKLELIENRTLDGGCAYVMYRVKRGRS